MTTKLQVIGGGKMGEALIGGLIAQDWARPDELAVLEPLASRRAELAEALPGVVVLEEPRAGTDTLLAVKPDQVGAALQPLSGLACPRLLSIAAGVRIASLESALDDVTAVIRAMPNTPALVAEGAAAISGGTAATSADLEWAASVLGYTLNALVQRRMSREHAHFLTVPKQHVADLLGLHIKIRSITVNGNFL